MATAGSYALDLLGGDDAFLIGVNGCALAIASGSVAVRGSNSGLNITLKAGVNRVVIVYENLSETGISAPGRPLGRGTRWCSRRDSNAEPSDP